MHKKRYERRLPIFILLLLPIIITVFLTACGAGGGGGDTGPDSTIPVAPTDVTATPGDGQVIGTWTEVPGASSYNLYMASESGVTNKNYASFSDGMKHNNITSPFVHTGLVNGTTYFFVVTAENSVGESVASNEVDATPLADLLSIHPGSMATARNGHTATLLSNGKVLITGGNDGSNELSSVELYDPATGIFTDSGNMTIARDEHASTLLSNKKVLITGGNDASMELYDPATETFTNIGEMPTVRYEHTATLLPNGKVLIAGGYDDNLNVITSAELYDPSTDSFSSTSKMAPARYGHTATLLKNGKVLITGGSDANDNVLSSSEIYDPATGIFTHIGNMTTTRYGHTATLLSNDKVLIAGGWDGKEEDSLSGAELYDPAAGTFKAIDDMTIPREYHTATLLPNGKVLILGGFNNGSDAFSSAELFNFSTGTFTAINSMVSISISPESATVATGGSQTFSATVTGSTNNKVTWSIKEGASGGTINSGGVYTAPSKPGTYHIVATSQADPNKSATATVDVIPVSVSINPESAIVATGGSQTFSAEVTGSTNNKVTWSIKEGASGGTINSGGVYTAPSKPGTYHIVATSQADPNKSAMATIQVMVIPLPISLPKTGQTTCYDSSGNIIDCTGTGQDGDLQQGVAWPSPRFTDNGDGTVRDNLTGLIWTKDGNAPGPAVCSPATAKTWQGALDYVACLNTNSYLGYSDWHLPDINELRSLVNAGQSDTSTWLNSQGFNNVQSSSYWSSTSDAYYPHGAWIVNMWVGYMYNFGFKTSNYYVWPVRSGQSWLLENSIISIPKTGQTTCYDSSGNIIGCTGTGQDGNLQRGVAWPSPRFTDNGDGTVTDNLTGLIWTKDGNAPGSSACSPATTKTWQGALDYVACLNTNSYLGYTDWRLPNVNELKSLVHAGQSSISAWLNTQGFNNVQSSYYWSSTSGAGYTYYADGAWVVSMWSGGMVSSSKTSYYYVWPVRSGQ